MPSTEFELSEEIVINHIFFIRGMKVLLDRDLAVLYGVETRTLKQAVRRNLNRFPNDFMFEVSANELQSMVSHSVIPDKRAFGSAAPFALLNKV